MAMERRYISMLHRLHNVPPCKRDEIPLFILLGQLRALDDGAPIDYQRKDKHLTHNDIGIYLSGMEIQYQMPK
jgi:hypothetical protein